MASDAYLKASVAIAKGEERSGMCKTGLERKRHLRKSNASCWEDVQLQGRIFLVKSIKGFAIVE